MKSFWVYSVIFVVVISLALYGIGFIPADVGFSLIGEFEDVPPSDLPLEEWISSQKGVFKAFVSREKKDNLWVIKVIGGRTRNGRGEPPFPKVDEKAFELGYRAGTGGFRRDPN